MAGSIFLIIFFCTFFALLHYSTCTDWIANARYSWHFTAEWTWIEGPEGKCLMDYRFEGYIKFQYHTSPYRLDYPQMRLEFNCSTNFTWIESDMALWFNFILTIGLSNLWISSRSVKRKTKHLCISILLEKYKQLMVMVYLHTFTSSAGNHLRHLSALLWATWGNQVCVKM